MQVLGTQTFLSTPDVNGTPVLLNGGGTPQITTGTTAARPAFGNAGDLYVDTTTNNIYRDTGTSWDNLSSGKLLQMVSGAIAATSGTTQIVTAVTATPTITDGFQIWSTTFTPISATSRICVEFYITSSHGNAARPVIVSCFAGSTNIGSVATYMATANVAYPIGMSVVYSPGSTSTITISARAGAVGTGTLTVGRYNGTTNTLGGAASTEFTIMEIQ